MQSEYAVKTDGIQQKSQTCKSNRRFLFESVQQKFDEAGLGKRLAEKELEKYFKKYFGFFVRLRKNLAY